MHTTTGQTLFYTNKEFEANTILQKESFNKIIANTDIRIKDIHKL